MVFKDALDCQEIGLCFAYNLSSAIDAEDRPRRKAVFLLRYLKANFTSYNSTIAAVASC